VTVAWRTIDRDASLGESRAQRIDVIDGVGEVTEAATACVLGLVPVVVMGAFCARRLDVVRRQNTSVKRPCG
jgi:hypothetical protein